jgi:hypothetical protein
MPDLQLPDLHPVRLRARLSEDLAEALADDLIDSTQYWRLQTLRSGRPDASLRLARVTLAGDPAACNDVLIIEDGPVHYLHTRLHGIERFTLRSALNAVLLERLGASAKNAVLEEEQVTGDPFSLQAKALIAGRVQALQRFDQQLQALPDLSCVLLKLFRQKIGLQEAAQIDQPARLLLQHVEGETVRRTLFLPQQLLEHYHQTALPPGQARRWLTPEGRPFAASSVEVLEKALVDAHEDLNATVDKVLRAHWDGDGRQAELARALARNFEHTLLRQRDDDSLTQAQMQWLGEALNQTLLLEGLTLRDGVQPELTLDTFRVLRTDPEATDGYLYSAAQGFEPFDSLDALNHRFQALNRDAQAPEGLSQDQRVSFLSMGSIQVHLSPAAGFAEWAAALIRWQVRSAQQALPHYQAKALDIRPWVDLRLPACAATAPLADLAPMRAGAWLSRLDALQQRQQAWEQQPPSLQDCAQALLDDHLAVLTWPHLKADKLLVQMAAAGTGGTHTRRLTDLLLESVSGATPFTASACAAKLIQADGHGVPAPAPQFDTQLLDMLFDQAAPLLRSRYQSACNLPRPGLYEVYEQALRIEAAGLRDALEATPAVVDSLDQALDLPTAVLRRHLGTRKVQVHGLTLSVEQGAPVRLESTFVIHVAAAASGPVLLWSPATGLQYLPSLTSLITRLLADLHSPEHRENVLALVAEAQRVPLRSQLAQATPPIYQVRTLAVDGNLIQALLDSRQRWVASAMECAWALAAQGGFEAGLFNDCLLHSLQARAVQPDLRALAGTLRNAQLQKCLPGWTQRVSADQLQRYANLLYDCLETQKPENYYLNGVPSLKPFALQKLRSAIESSHGALNLDLNQVRITFKTYDTLPPLTGNTPSGSPAVAHSTTLSLANAALRQFSGKQSAVANVTLADGGTPPAWLTPSYIGRLVEQLDVGQQYRAMLEDVLTPVNATYRQRGQLYSLTLCAQLRELALRMRMQEQLSQTAYDYLECVLSMPDDVARQVIDAPDIVLRQVRLVAQAGMKPDAVTGMYLIGPRNPELGPVVLLSPYNLEFGLREYPSRAAFMQHTRSNERLAALIVWRLEDSARPRYDHGGLKEPHLPWSVESDFDLPLAAPPPPELDTDAVIGNALDFLFEDNTHLLQMMARRQTVTRAEAQWQAFITLATLGLEQGSLFLPGELAVMVNAWQSQLLLKSSANSLVQKRWGQALAEFCAALSNLAGHRRAVAAERPTHPSLVAHKHPSPASRPEPTHTSTLEFGWRQQQLPADLKARLAPFEQRQVALHELLADPLTHLYRTAQGANFYAPITGKVYQVGLFDQHWYIVRDEQRGPRIRLNGQQHWELDLQWGLRGGGACFSSQEPDLAELQGHIDALFETEASGMPAIHKLHSLQGQQFTAAHSKALLYVRTYLENLNSTQAQLPLAPQTLTLLKDFFKVGVLTPPLLMKLRTLGRQLFGALLDTTLNPATSSRVIMGRSKHPELRLIAFTMKDDPLQRIYLTERYFKVPNWMFQYTRVAGTGFSVTEHYQAGTLIHELSHQVLDTQDIAYVESSVPFLDLMVDDKPLGKQLKDETERLQQRKLSADAPATELFTLIENGAAVDVRGRAAKRILTITGSESLAEAREDFYGDAAKRTEIMLNNADSLALLITLLGRRRF